MNKSAVAKFSLVLGIIGLLLITIFNFYFSKNIYANYIKTNLFFESLIPNFYNLAWIFDISGIIFGILGLYSKKRKLAITGIGLSIAGLFGYLIFFIILWITFGSV